MAWFLVNLLRPVCSSYLTRPSGGIFILTFVAVAVCTVFFCCGSLVAGGLASGRHAHNPPTKLFSSLHLSSPLVIISKCLQIWSFCLWISYNFIQYKIEISLWLQQKGNKEFWTQLIKGSRIHDILEVTKHFSDHQMNMFLAFTSECLQHLIICEEKMNYKNPFCTLKGSGVLDVWHRSRGCLLS